MWTCKYCLKEFDFKRTTDKGNHSKWCHLNPNRLNSGNDLKNRLKVQNDKKYGEVTDFTVVCETCKNNFIVSERHKLHPQKNKYFCSRKCANSIGGKTKAKKYGYTQYQTIAEKFHKKECIVCGVTDILDVHHLDENRQNNDPSNLVFLCPNDHYRLHRNNDERVKKIIYGDRVC